ncbi:hypothetical protein N9Y17_03730, partial [Gammaproteobacteria bacterium]|nr:hypothetical protein [Gammaproteobacteria bacterium]
MKYAFVITVFTLCVYGFISFNCFYFSLFLLLVELLKYSLENLSSNNSIKITFAYFSFILDLLLGVTLFALFFHWSLSWLAWGSTIISICFLPLSWKDYQKSTINVEDYQKHKKMAAIILNSLSEITIGLMSGYLLYMGQFATLWPWVVMLGLVVSSTCRFVEMSLYFNKLFSNDSQFKQKMAYLSWDFIKYLLIVFVATASRVMSIHTPMVALLIQVNSPYLIAHITMISIFLVFIEVGGKLINTPVTIANQIRKKLPDRDEKITKFFGLVFSTLGALSDVFFAVIGVWVDHFPLPVADPLMILFGVCRGITSILLQSAFNNKDVSQNLPKDLKFSRLIFLSVMVISVFSFCGKVVSKFTQYYFFFKFFGQVTFWGLNTVFFIALLATFYVVLVTLGSEITKSLESLASFKKNALGLDKSYLDEVFSASSHPSIQPAIQ